MTAIIVIVALAFLISISLANRDKRRDCPKCFGSGMGQSENYDCYRCNGKGKL